MRFFIEFNTREGENIIVSTPNLSIANYGAIEEFVSIYNVGEYQDLDYSDEYERYIPLDNIVKKYHLTGVEQMFFTILSDRRD